MHSLVQTRYVSIFVKAFSTAEGASRFETKKQRMVVVIPMWRGDLLQDMFEIIAANH